jgi:aminoglycoside phosphotransferase (APT) family kinase protein
MSWWQVPDHVRSVVETSLGSEIVDAVTPPGGFSPGAKARVRTRGGARAFVKALSVERHAPSVRLYRNEAAVMPYLPVDLPVPRLLDVYDDGNWVALVYEDVDGRSPAIPWCRDELDRVAAAIADLGAALDPSPWPDAPSFADVNAGVMRAWQDLVTSPPSDLEPSIRGMLERLAVEEVDLAEVVKGEALLHNDIRSDNLLLRPDGRVVFVDWGMPCKGAVWQDVMMFALTPDLWQGADPDLLVRSHPLTRSIPASSVDVVVLAGYAVGRLWRGRSDEMSAYHLASADASLRWVRRRADRVLAPDCRH